MVCAFSRVHRVGPRKEIYYEPEEVKAAIVTCGGLCLGLNDVIRQVLSFQYRSSKMASSLHTRSLNKWCAYKDFFFCLNLASTAF